MTWTPIVSRIRIFPTLPLTAIMATKTDNMSEIEAGKQQPAEMIEGAEKVVTEERVELTEEDVSGEDCKGRRSGHVLTR